MTRLLTCMLALAAGLATWTAAAEKAAAPKVDQKIGLVLAVNGTTAVRLSLGREEGVLEGNVFAVYSQTQLVRLPLTGDVALKKEQEVAKVRVTAVEPHESNAEVLTVTDGVKLVKGMTVIQVLEQLNENSPPRIVSVRPDVTEIDGGKTISINTSVVDTEGDAFELAWSATGGELALSRTTRQMNKWVAPLDKGEFTITITATDAWGNASKATVVLRSRGRAEGSRREFAISRVMGRDLTPVGDLYFTSMKFDNNGDLFVNDQKKGGIFRHFLDIPSKPEKISQYKDGEKELTLKAPLCFDVTDDKIFVCDGNGGFIRIFAKNGQYLGTIGAGKGSGIGFLGNPVDMAVAGDGTIYIVDSDNQCVEVLAPDGRSRFRAGRTGTGEGEFQKPVDIEIARDGSLFVLDAGKPGVLIFSDRMEYRRTILCPATEDMNLVDMVMDRINNRFYILDAGEEKVMAFTTAGEFIGLLGAEKEAWHHVVRPASVAVNTLGQVYVASAATTQMTRYNLDSSFSGRMDVTLTAGGTALAATGKRIFLLESRYYQILEFDYYGWCLGVIGGNSKKNGTIGEGVRLAANDQFVYVLDLKYRSVHQYTHLGEEVAPLGDKGEEPGKFMKPADIALDARGNLYVLDTDLKRVTVFGPDGKLLTVFASDVNASVKMVRPALLAVAADGGTIFIYDQKLYTILKYDARGVAQASYGQKGSKEIGQFGSVTYLGLDEAGYCVAADPDANRVQKIDFTAAAGRPFVQFIKETALYQDATLYTVDPFGQLVLYDGKGKLILMR
ncbi:MAG: hypothetical protein ABIF71_14220 [Planctomycetota bacterium]